MANLTEGERRLKRYRITGENGGAVTISNVACRVYNNPVVLDENGDPVIVDQPPTEIINNGSSSVTIQSLFDTLQDDIEPNQAYKVRWEITIGEEIYTKDQIIAIEE